MGTCNLFGKQPKSFVGDPVDAYGRKCALSLFVHRYPNVDVQFFGVALLFRVKKETPNVLFVRMLYVFWLNNKCLKDYTQIA